MNKCCICGNYFDGLGNNPQPIKKDGRCCNFCNDNIVVPIRIFTLGRGFALLIKENTCELLKPQNKVFTLEELQNAVGGYIEIAPSSMEHNYIVVNEEGLYQNELARKILGKKFVGNVLICPKELFE